MTYSHLFLFMKRKTIADYYKKYIWLFIIGIAADIMVDVRA